MKSSLPKRYRPFGVGKFIGGNVYIHRQYEHLLPQEEYSRVRKLVPTVFNFTIIKFNLKTRAFTFIESPDFDTAHEPIVGDMIVCTPDVTSATWYKKRVILSSEYDPLIYHHKWLMVKDDYSGFNVEVSKARSVLWTSLTDVDKSRIGRRSYWRQFVLTRLNTLE